MIGSTKYTTKPNPKQNTVSLGAVIMFIVISFILVIIIAPMWIENWRMENYGDEEISNEIHDDDNELFEILKENDAEDNIFRYLKVIDYEDDKERLLQEKGQYIARARVGVIIGDYINNQEAITIEVFNNKEDLKLRVAYLQAKNDYLNEVYGDGYGFLPNMIDLPSNRVIYTKGNALLTFDSSIAYDKMLYYCNLFYQAVKEIDYQDKYVLDNDEIEVLKEENNKKILKWQEIYSKDKLLSPLNELKDKMNKRVEIAYASNNKALITSILDELKFYNVEKFKEQYSLWNNQLTKAKQSLEQGNVLPDMLEKQNQYKQTVYSDGKYIVGEDILPGEYVIVKNDGVQNAKVSIDNTQTKVYGNTIININVNYSGKIKYDLLSLEGVTMYHIDNSPQLELKVPGTFKVGKHIEAGKYEISADSYVNYYLIDNFEGLLDKSKLEKFYYEIGPEPKTITVKDGQYLVLNNNSIQIKKK